MSLFEIIDDKGKIIPFDYVRAITYSSAIVFPDFKEGTMYKGMKPETKYDLKELGIEYDE